MTFTLHIGSGSTLPPHFKVKILIGHRLDGGNSIF